jgi:hypothetical protein
MFLSVHGEGGWFSDDEIDAAHDAMVAGEGHMFREVMHGRAGPAPSKWSVLPSQTRQPWDWLSESDQEGEIMRYAVEG